jgi:ADP-ribose pyrophosphatase
MGKRREVLLDDELYEPTVGESTIYRGKIVHLKELQVRLPNGRVAKREVVYHPGAVAVLAEPQPGYLIFVEQFRKAPGEVLLEIPAGKLDERESAEACAHRELAEETGYRCGKMEKIYEFFTSPGFANEKITLFHATLLEAGEEHPDEDEFVRVLTLSEVEIRNRLMQGMIRDAKTLVAVLWWLSRKNHQGSQS